MTQPRRILWLVVFAAGFMLSPGRAAAQSATVTDDAFLSSNSATQLLNLNGQGISLVVAGSSATFGSAHVGTTKTYIKFQLQSSLPPTTAAANVAKATLKLYISPGTSPSGAIDIYPVIGAWTESTLIPSSPPALSTTPFANGISVGKANSFLVIDVTQLVKDWLEGSANGGFDNDGIALVADTSTTSVVFDSKEDIVTSHEPRLEIVLVNSGAQGVPGQQGPTGPAGPAGAAGAAATVQTGTTMTVPAGTPASVLNGGTANAAVLNFLIPQGPTGLTGPQGAQGQIGPQGTVGQVGPFGPAGPQGPAGVNNQGNWVAATQYNPSDAVFDSGSFWIANAVNMGSEPSPSNTNWQLLAAGINNRGVWNASNNYNVNDAVSDNGSSWLAIAANGANANNSCEPSFPPSPCAADWQLLAAAGTPGGTGPQGLVGPAGPQGSIGPIGPMGPQGIAPPNIAVTNAANTFTGGDQTVNGNLLLTGVGNGITFPDGTSQTTAASAPTQPVPSGSMILGSSGTPPTGYTNSGILGGSNLWYPGPDMFGVAVTNFGGTQYGPYSAVFPAAAAIGGQIYVAGGLLPTTGATKTLAVLDTLSNVWTPKAQLNFATSRSALGTISGKLYLFGGEDSNGSVSNAIWAYDPNTDRWTSNGSLPNGVKSMAAVSYGSDPLLFLLGGLDSNGLSVGDVSTFRANGSIISQGSINPRDSFAAAEVSGKIYVFGGSTTIGTGTQCIANSEAFDPIARRSQPIASLPTPLVDASAVSFGGKIYILGGVAEPTPSACQRFIGGNTSNVVYVYDPTTDSYSTAPLMPTARAGFAAVFANGKIFALGGTTTLNPTAPTSVVEEFAPPIYIITKN